MISSLVGATAQMEKAVWADWSPEVTLTVNGAPMLALVGLPDTTPPLDSVSPAGSLPLASDHL